MMGPTSRERTGAMVELFTREGSPVPTTAAIIEDEKGRPCFQTRRPCGRCGGQGRSDRWAHTGFVCFDCDGECYRGTMLVKVYTAAEIEKLNVRRDKLRATKQAKIAAADAKRQEEAMARAAEFKEAHGALMTRAWDYLHARYGTDEHSDEVLERAHSDYVYDIITKAERRNDISEGQIEAVKAALDRYDAEQARKAAADYIGEVGQRLTLKVTVIRVYNIKRNKFHAPWETETLSIITMRTDEGNTVVSKSTSFYKRRGTVLTIKGTVKEHTVYNDEKQTDLQRIKVIEVHQAGVPEDEED